MAVNPIEQATASTRLLLLAICFDRAIYRLRVATGFDISSEAADRGLTDSSRGEFGLERLKNRTSLAKLEHHVCEALAGLEEAVAVILQGFAQDPQGLAPLNSLLNDARQGILTSLGEFRKAIRIAESVPESEVPARAEEALKQGRNILIVLCGVLEECRDSLESAAPFTARED